MTKLLEKALSKATKLPTKEQDALGAILLDEIAANQRWDNAFANSADVLAALADEALTEHQAGKTQPFDPAN